MSDFILFTHFELIDEERGRQFVTFFHHHHHHHHQGLDPLIRSVSRVTAALANFQSCASSGDSELGSVSSGWITSPSLSKFGGS